MIRNVLAALVLGLTVAGAASAQTLSSPIASIAFLIGDWHGEGKPENGLTDRGTSSMHLIVGGNALLRRDHTDVADNAGKLQQSFDQIMLIYPEDGTLRADYLDGAHTIHYRHVDVEPGQSVQFTSATAKDAPAYRLTYRLTAPDALSIRFEMAPPGSQKYNTIAEGVLKRD